MNEELKKTLEGLKPEEKQELLNILSENKGQAKKARKPILLKKNKTEMWIRQ